MREVDSVDLQEIKSAVLAIWASVLNVPNHSLSETSNFFHLGGDSVGAARVTIRVNNKYDLDDSVTQIFETPTPDQYATYVYSKLRR